MKTQLGLGLIELLIALTILAILLAIGIPALETLQAKSRTHARISMMYDDFRYARQLAITYQNNITLCPLDSSGQCQNRWELGYSAFIDTPPRGQLNSADQLLLQRSAIHPQDRITANKSQYRFTTEGFTFDTGSIRYCPLSHDHPLRRQLTISATGGIRYNDNPREC